MNALETINNLSSKSNLAGQKAGKIKEYHELLQKGSLDKGEFEDLVRDLARIDQVNESTAELDQLIMLRSAALLLLTVV